MSGASVGVNTYRNRSYLQFGCLVICSEALHIRRRISVSVLGGKNMTGEFENWGKKFFQDASHLSTLPVCTCAGSCAY